MTACCIGGVGAVGESVARGEPFLDPWVSEGRPRVSGLAQLSAAAASRRRVASPPRAPLCDAADRVAWLSICCSCSCRPSVYFGARRLRLSRPPPARRAARRCAKRSRPIRPLRPRLGRDHLARSGLYTQLFALHFLILASAPAPAPSTTAAAARPLRSFLAITSFRIWSSATSLRLRRRAPLVGPAGQRPRRLVGSPPSAFPALVLVAWFVVPLLRGVAEIAHSRWETSTSGLVPARPRSCARLSGHLLDGGRFRRCRCSFSPAPSRRSPPWRDSTGAPAARLAASG